MNELSIETYVEDKGSFKPLCDVISWKPELEGYIPGFVEVSGDDQTFFGEDLKSDIFLWWAQIPIMLNDLAHSNPSAADGVFHDLPVSMRWHISDDQLIWSVAGREHREMRFLATSALHKVYIACQETIRHMQRIYPEISGGYEPIMKMLNRNKQFIQLGPL